MKVFVIRYTDRNECTDIVGVFTSEEKAWDAIDRIYEFENTPSVRGRIDLKDVPFIVEDWFDILVDYIELDKFLEGVI